MFESDAPSVNAARAADPIVAYQQRHGLESDQAKSGDCNSRQDHSHNSPETSSTLHDLA
ncbi:MAG: hypothetical protein ACRDYA_05630 [Egibacteraceae bacterium]